MKVDGRWLTDAERIRLMLTIEHEDIYAPDDFIPLPETQAAPPVSQSAPATVAALDDSEDWPAARFQELVARVAGVDENEVQVMS